MLSDNDRKEIVMVKIEVKIDGMMCGMCESHMNDMFRQKFNVKKVTSSHSKGTSVIITENDISDEDLKKEIAETGYTFISATREPYEKKGLFARFKK